MIPTTNKKRRRAAHNCHSMATRPSAAAALIDSFADNTTATETSQKLRRTTSHSNLSFSQSSPFPPIVSFGDDSTADVVLCLVPDPSTFVDDVEKKVLVQMYLHSHALQRSQYFSVLLSNRWQLNNTPKSTNLLTLKLPICPSDESVENYLAVIKLLYAPQNDGDGFPIDSASYALDLLPAALHLLFEDLVKFCVRFLEAVPWTEEEERRVLNLIPYLNGTESVELLARLSPKSASPSEDMLQGLISQACHNYPHTAFAKAFVAMLLKDVSSRESARKVLERAFEKSLRVVRESLDEYSSPDFRGHHEETEAKQKANLQALLTNGRHLCWLVERMVELKVADKVVQEWSEQPLFTADLQRAFRDDAWKNIVPGLPAVLLKCTSKIATAVASGAILAARQVRMKLVKDWLPVLNVCRDHGTSMFPHKTLYLELEKTFLKIISTLPMSDAQELLQQCLGFSTRNVEDCKHLVAAFNTWFRRAMKPPQVDNLH